MLNERHGISRAFRPICYVCCPSFATVANAGFRRISQARRQEKNVSMQMLFKSPLAFLLAIGFWLVPGWERSLDAGMIHATATTVGSSWFKSEQGGSALVSAGGGSASGLAYSYIDEYGRQKLGVLSAGTTTNSDPAIEILSKATWTDVVRIQGEDLPEYLTFTYYVRGSVFAAGDFAWASFFVEAITNQRVFGGDSMSSGKTASGEVVVESSSEWSTVPGGKGVVFQVPIFPVLTPDGSIVGVGLWSIEASALIGVGAGTARSNYSHTALFGLVTLPDGRTPEEAGYTLTFDSGLTSPNLLATAVPEPASLTLLGIGGTCLSIFRWRRRRATAA